MSEGTRTTDAVEILRRRYVGDDAERRASVEEERAQAAAALEGLREELDLDGLALDPDEIFRDVRDPSPGREVDIEPAFLLETDEDRPLGARWGAPGRIKRNREKV